MAEKHEDNSKKESVENSLAADYVPKGKLGNLPMSNNREALSKDNEKIQKELEKFKEDITKKYKFIEAIGIVPDQAAKIIEEEYEIGKEDSEKGLIHILTIIPEEKFKEIGAIRIEAINLAKKINGKFWVHIMTPVDLWNLGLDSKFDVLEALAMSYPLLDKGLLGSLRVAQIHKSLVLKKFEKYVTSYILVGSLVRGEATKTSDVDIFIVIDDTDVKRMPRLELKEKLRSIVNTYIQEAQAIAGVKNILNVQSYLLTEFWEAVKDAHPVMFTFIRDGIALYDRGAFLPWKSLLKMGKIKPSPEAIDMFMSSGNKLKENIDRRLLDIAVLDIYWGVLTPTQGILMLFGLAPPTPKETLRLIREVFFEKEKILEEKYVKIIEEIVHYYKDYEHGKVKTISGTALDKMAKNALEYMGRLKKLRVQIEKRVQEKSIEETYKDLLGMLGSFLNKKSESLILKAFDDEFIRSGKFPPRYLENLKFIIKTKSNKKTKEHKKSKGKESKQGNDVDTSRRYASEIMNSIIEYGQRKELSSINKSKYVLKGREMSAEVFFLKDVFVVDQNSIKKLSGEKLVNTNTEELRKQIMESKDSETKVDFKALQTLHKIFGEFELIN